MKYNMTVVATKPYVLLLILVHAYWFGCINKILNAFHYFACSLAHYNECQFAYQRDRLMPIIVAEEVRCGWLIACHG